MLRRVLSTLLVVAALAFPVGAQQDGDESENGYFIRQIEKRLSKGDMSVRLSDVDGALSRSARVGQITISDKDGPWLTIHDAELDWTRSSLLRGRVNIQRLAAKRIEIPRRPNSAGGQTPQTEAKPFTLPDLPVSVKLGELDIARVEIGEPVFGEAITATVAGGLTFDDAALDATLDAERIDRGKGGSLDLVTQFDSNSRDVLIDIDAQEDAGGIVSRMLNLDGEPPVALLVKGEGKLDDLDVAIDLNAENDDLVTGTVALRRGEQGLGFGADLRGQLARMTPPRYRPFLAGEASVELQGVSMGEGAVRLDKLEVDGRTAKLSAQAETLKGGFLRRLVLDGQIGDGSEAVPIPTGEMETTLRKGVVAINYGETEADRWSGTISAEDITADDISAQTLALELGGRAESLDDPSRRMVTINVTGGLRGLDARDVDMARALGDRLDVTIRAELPGAKPALIETAQLDGKVGRAALRGLVDDFAFKGEIGAQIPQLSPLSGLLNRDLAGGADLTLDGTYAPLSGQFDFTLSGTTDNLELGQAQADALLAGETRLSGRALRDEAGLLLRDIALRNAQMGATLAGVINSNRSDLALEGRIRDLSTLSENAGGALTLTATAEGRDGVTNLKAEGRLPEGNLEGRAARDIVFSFSGVSDDAGLRGDLAGDGTLGGGPVTLAGAVNISDTLRTIEDLKLVVGASRLAGAVAQNPQTGLFDGDVTIKSDDISDAAALALLDARGAVDISVQLSGDAGGQSIAVAGDIDELQQGQFRIGQAVFDADVADAFRQPLIDADLSGANITVGETVIEIVEGKAHTEGRRTEFEMDARLANGTTLDAAGTVAQLDEGTDIALDTGRLAQNGAVARLLSPATIRMRGDDIRLGDIALEVNGGRVNVSGNAGDQLDLSADLANVPLDIVNAVRPSLNAGGIVSGEARVTGTRTRPDVNFDLVGRGLEAAPLRNAGLPPFDVDARGEMTGNDQLAFDGALRTGDGVSALVNGTTSLSGGPVALDIDLQSFPLAFVNRFVDGQDLRGTVTGTGRVGGRLNDPQVNFDLTGQGISAARLRPLGVETLNVTATGLYAGRALNVDQLQIDGPAGLSLDAQGRLPFDGAGMDIAAQGALPLDLLDNRLASRNARADGLVNLDLRAQGTPRSPQLSGTVRANGATFVDGALNIRLETINLDAALAGDRISLNTLTGDFARGGTFQVGGAIGIAAPFPADIDILLRGVRYTDGDLVATRFNGDLSLDGPIYGGGLVSGQIKLNDTEISIPQGFGGAQGLKLGVKHVNTPPAVEATLARSAIRARQTSRGARPTDGLRLAIDILAEERVFVRGRGLDSELGGAVEIGGTLGAPEPVGRFELTRGRLNLLGQRIDLDEGALTLNGTLTPRLRLVALTQSSDVTARVIVSGPVNDLDLTFESTPELPEDEVLARVIFDRSISELSAFQLAQLAAALSELTGGGNGGVLSGIREAAGFDNLDIKTDDEGETAVQAGKYLSDDVYTTLETNSAGKAEVGVRVDISEHITGRLTVDNEGESSVGVFYERDY